MFLNFILWCLVFTSTIKSVWLQKPERISHGNYIELAGYVQEKHIVETADSYILSMFRIPRKKTDSRPVQNKPVAFLMHGLLSSSFDWTVLGPEKALAYMLSDAGYDVWMGNFRGNTYSRKHAFLSPNSKEFWDFSWHEMGQFDLPAMIDYVLQKTGQSKLHYIGHSQGTTAFFVMASIKPQYNSKIKAMHAYSPEVFLSNMKSPLMKMIAPKAPEIEAFVERFHMYEITPNTELFRNTEWGAFKSCQDDSKFQDVCANVLFLVGGVNVDQLNKTIIPAILLNTPAGSSFKQFLHFSQLYTSGRFQMFDYGSVKNYVRYGNSLPPNYPLGKVKANVYLHYGRNDWLGAIEDVNKLAGKLPNCKQVVRVPHPRWSHLDFVYGMDADQFLYSPTIDLMEADQ